MESGAAFLSEDAPLVLQELAIRRNWDVLSFLFAINHACVTTAFIFVTSLLSDMIAYHGLALTYIVACLCALFLSVPAVASLGPRGAMVLGMYLNSAYMGTLVIAISVPDLAFVFLFGSCLGGLGTGIMWTAQGVYLSRSSEALASAQGCTLQVASTQHASYFAFIFLLLEVLFKAGAATIHNSSLGFSICFLCAFLSAVLVKHMVYSTRSTQEHDRSPAEQLSVAVRLWTEPRLWLLSPTNFAFGFGAAYVNGFVNDQVTNEQLGKAYVGYYSALTPLVAAAASYVAGLLARSGDDGKSVALVVGALTLIAVPGLALFGGIDHWGRWLAALYALLGVGRAMFESTNKAVFVDFFPGLVSEEAFANVTMQMSLAFTACFFLTPYIGGTALAVAALALALLIIPLYCVAKMLGPLQVLP